MNIYFKMLMLKLEAEGIAVSCIVGNSKRATS